MGLGNLSGGELVILLVICLLVFGAHRLPEAGKAVGKGLREFQRALNETRDAVNDEPGPTPSPPPPPAPASPRAPRPRIRRPWGPPRGPAFGGGTTLPPGGKTSPLGPAAAKS